MAYTAPNGASLHECSLEYLLMSTYQPTYHSQEVRNKLWGRWEFCAEREYRCPRDSEAERYWQRQGKIVTWQLLHANYNEPIPSDKDCIIALDLF